MKESPILRLLDRFERQFTRRGIDYRAMRAILRIKLLMDSRRMPTLMANASGSARKRREESNLQFGSLLLYALTGFMLVPIILLGNHVLFQFSLVWGVIMFIVMTAMIADFSSVLLDVRDRAILDIKPVDRRTIGAAKSIHVLWYLLTITLSVGLPPLIAGTAKYGAAFPFLFIPGLLLSDMLGIAVTALVYLLVLRLFDGDKLKDLINYIQIAMTIAVVLGYQLIARSFDLVQLQFTLKAQWWEILVPPFWYAAPLGWMYADSGGLYIRILALLGVFVPLLAVALYIRLLPAFEHYLQKLSQEGAGAGRSGGRILGVIAHLCCGMQQEKAFFLFAYRNMSRERGFKLKVYPIMAYSMVLPFIFMFQALRGGTWSDISSLWVFLTYFMLSAVPNVVAMLRYTDKPKAAWLYEAVPLQSRGLIYKGIFKAMLIRIMLPAFVSMAVLMIVLLGLNVLPDLIAIWLSGCIYTLISSRMMGRALPFAEKYANINPAGGWKTLLLLILLLGLAGAHLICVLLVPYGSWISLALLLAVNLLYWKYAFGGGLSWEDRENEMSISG
ncbi:hypothetical protein Q5741_08005 [Paenibacillus sp. JX-17]|uniref:ABC transporter permease n=1 Tax=Paenibacillus lacisoli TaxID=3064525 RepID=A0ABT9CAR6_9BACL|nr:hypothetical protein [Paenibacillus sp. JX-17]MDO7906360.1 hypothetical protein [Paenibacillus sp. JX-17]